MTIISEAAEERLLTPTEAAKMLGQREDSLRKFWSRWGIPAVRVGRSLRFREVSIRGWIKDHEVEA